jgi:signal transduction histidine kinase
MRFVSPRRLPPLLADALLAIATGAIAAGATVPASRHRHDIAQLDALGLAIIAIGAGALLWRRRAPEAVLAASIVSTLTFLTSGYAYGPVFLLTWVAMYSVAVVRDTRRAVTVAAVAIAVHLPWSIFLEDDPEGPLITMIATAAWLAAPTAIGIAVRTTRQARARTAEEDRVRLGYEERLRIAQEVHDTVGHSLAVISMNAGAALHVLSKQDGPAPQVERSLRAIRQASGGALDELRLALTGFSQGRTVRTPGLALLTDLVSATNVDGLDVTLVETGTRAAVPAPVDLAGYRIAQEALTNVVRHAHATDATVAVEYRPDGVTLTVTDDGTGAPVANPLGTGLSSMRARAESVGGTFDAGPRPDGGYAVRATLPT